MQSRSRLDKVNETAIVHDLTLTYLKPAPVQLERRVIDFKE